MKIVKQDLLKVLSLVSPGIAKKDIVEQSGHYIFSGKDIATFNDQVCVIHPFESDISFSVKASDLYKIVDNIAEAEFEITLDGDTLNIKSKGTKAKLSTIVSETAMVTHLIEIIRQAMIGKNFWKPLPKDFTEGIYLCAFSASRDLTTGVRSCCAIKNDAIYTTDGIRVSTYIMDSKMEGKKEKKEIEGKIIEIDPGLLLPAKDASELVKYKVIEYGISDNWAHFKTKEDIIFNCKVMKGEYPFKTIDGLFEEKDPDLTFPTDLKTNIEAIIPFAEGESDSDKSITLNISKGRIECKAKKERGEITKTIESDYEGEAFTMLVNPVFFSQVLRNATEFALLGNKGQFQSDNFYHVLALPEKD
jgi:DNA polymerase III sliding clamp (beta) subunit (PCNA family)